VGGRRCCRAHATHNLSAFKTWFGRKRTTYVGIIRGRFIGKEVTTEFTLLESLDVQINKKERFVLDFKTWFVSRCCCARGARGMLAFKIYIALTLLGSAASARSTLV
jgi:hypothetical protein